jgi:nucleoside-diphosphate-sugar epimerase
MSNIVITGINSFIGVHLAKYFSSNKYNVIGTISRDISKYNGIKKVRIVEALNSKVKIEKLDITQTDEIKNIIDKTKPVYWIHHAGWATDYGSFEYDFVNGFEVNVKPLSTLYPALKKCECKGIIITGSSAEYGDGNQADKEIDAAFPTMPYGLSKLTETLYAQQLANKYNLPTRVARVYIPFGTLDAPNKLIPSAINHIKKNESIDLSTCEQKRDFIYIEDLINGYEALLDDLNRGSLFDIFNICSGNATMLKDLLLMIVTKLGSSHDLLKFGARQMRAGEALVSYGSNKKAIEILGWKPRNLNHGIREYLSKCS